jgi:hypothetical protein
MLVGKIFFDYACVSPENFFDLPSVDNIFGKNLYDLVKILGNVGQNMTTPPHPSPPPNVDGFATSLKIPGNKDSGFPASQNCCFPEFPIPGIPYSRNTDSRISRYLFKSSLQ